MLSRTQNLLTDSMHSIHFLHINIAQPDGYILVSNGNNEILSKVCIPTMNQSMLINSSMNQAMSEAGLIDVSQSISAISVNNGPGSYTGLRVSLATAKGLALGWNKPLILHNYLDLLASKYISKDAIAVVIKARTDEYFMTIYDGEKCILSPAHAMKEDCVDFIKKHKAHTIVTDDIESFSNSGVNTALIDTSVENALSHKTLLRFQNQLFDDLAYSEPFYLKPAYVTTAKNNILHKN